MKNNQFNTINNSQVQTDLQVDFKTFNQDFIKNIIKSTNNQNDKSMDLISDSNSVQSNKSRDSYGFFKLDSERKDFLKIAKNTDLDSKQTIKHKGNSEQQIKSNFMNDLKRIKNLQM